MMVFVKIPYTSSWRVSLPEYTYLIGKKTEI